MKLAFKPYETNVLSQQNQNSFKSSSSLNLSQCSSEPEQVRPSSKSSMERVPSRSKSNATPTSTELKLESEASNRKTVSPAGSSQRGASPIVRSGMEVLSNANGTAQHPKEMSSMAAAAAAAAAAYKAAGPYGLNPLSALCCPPGMEQHANPAFRPPFAGGFSHHHAAMLAAAANGGAAGGYPGAPGAGPGAGQPNPYISYQRIKTPAGGEAIVPVCKDPYCPGCPYSAHTQQMLMGAPCPAGCTQCEHQKYGMAMAASAAGLNPAHPYSQAAAAAAANAAAARSAPYVCSWVVGDAYCGKRFQTSDELFTHLRTHTGNLSDPAAAAAALAQSQAQSLLGTLFPPSALRAGYPTPPLSPMSAAAAAARYHPYGKPPGAMAGAPSPFGAAGAFNPAAAAAAAALGPYYSPYAMYGQRMGAAHQ